MTHLSFIHSLLHLLLLLPHVPLMLHLPLREPQLQMQGSISAVILPPQLRQVSYAPLDIPLHPTIHSKSHKLSQYLLDALVDLSIGLIFQQLPKHILLILQTKPLGQYNKTLTKLYMT